MAAQAGATADKLLEGKVDKFNGIIIEESSLPHDAAEFEPILVGSRVYRAPSTLPLHNAISTPLMVNPSISRDMEGRRTPWLLGKDSTCKFVIDPNCVKGILHIKC
jgi:hypothetical protein